MTHDARLPILDDFITPGEVESLIRCARAEDMGPSGLDITSAMLVPADMAGRAVMASRQEGVLAGAALLPTVAAVYNPMIQADVLMPDGSPIAPGDVVAEFTGPLRGVLAMERIALNFVTHLSGIASLTARYVALTRGTPARICDTRKTIPGLRALAKYAVTCGGGVNHRMGLHDAMLVKDNHIAHLPLNRLRQTLEDAIVHARRTDPPPAFVEIEVDRLDQLEQVLACHAGARPDMVLLDNMPPSLLVQAVALRNRLAPDVLLEASGGVNLDTVAALAAAGVDRISVGAITHSAPSLDLGLDIG